MNKLTQIIAATLVPIILSVGCAKKPKLIKEQGSENTNPFLVGKPIAVEKLHPTADTSEFYVILETDKGRFYCEYPPVGNAYIGFQKRAYGLIKAEKEDGDNENIKLIGEFDWTGIFQISSYEFMGEKVLK